MREPLTTHGYLARAFTTITSTCRKLIVHTGTIRTAFSTRGLHVKPISHVTVPRAPRYRTAVLQVLEGLEPVRKRPGMYIGGTGSDGLHHLVWEVVDNAVDEVQAGHATQVEVDVDLTTGACRGWCVCGGGGTRRAGRAAGNSGPAAWRVCGGAPTWPAAACGCGITVCAVALLPGRLCG